MKSVLFTNSSSEDFEAKYDGSPYLFKAGESRWMKEGLAKHFAKKLCEREILKSLKDKTQSVHPTVIEQKSVEYIGESIDARSEAEAEMLSDDANMKSVESVKSVPTAQPESAQESAEENPDETQKDDMVSVKEKPCCGSRSYRHKKGCPESDKTKPESA